MTTHISDALADLRSTRICQHGEISVLEDIDPDASVAPVKRFGSYDLRIGRSSSHQLVSNAPTRAGIKFFV